MKRKKCIILLQQMLVLPVATLLMYGCTGPQGLQSESAYAKPPSIQDAAEVKEYYYLDGRTLKLKEWVSSAGELIVSEWYLPNGEILWRTHWLCEVCGRSRGYGFYLDDLGRIWQIIQFRDELANGYGLVFDPPASALYIRKYLEIEGVAEEWRCRNHSAESNE